MRLRPVSGSPVLLREVEGRRAGGDDAQPLDMIGEQLEGQPDLRHVLRLVPRSASPAVPRQSAA